MAPQAWGGAESPAAGALPRPREAAPGRARGPGLPLRPGRAGIRAARLLGRLVGAHGTGGSGWRRTGVLRAPAEDRTQTIGTTMTPRPRPSPATTAPPAPRGPRMAAAVLRGMAGAACSVGIALAPAPASYAAEGAAVFEHYSFFGSGTISWTASVTDADGALTAQLCDEFGAHARAALGVAHNPSTVFTPSDGAAPSSTCVVSVSASLLAISGAERTMSLPSAPTAPIADAIGAQVRTVEATVYEGRIVEASEGAQVDHDSERNGWETAVWADTDEDLELTFDTSTGSTSSGASAGAPAQRSDGGSSGPGFYALVGAIVVLTIGALVVAFHAWARRTRGPRAR